MFRSPKDISFKKKEKVKYNAKIANSGYCCDLCGQGPWPSETDVDIHRKNVHRVELIKALKDENISICSICLRVQKNKKALFEHIVVNHLCCPPNATMINREIYICDHCHRLFFNKQLLITHMYHWHTKKTAKHANLKHICPVCHKSIRAKSSWFHLLYHGTFNVGTCPICLNTFESHSEMLEHVKCHPSLFRCDICNYETTKQCYFDNHLAKHKKLIEGVNSNASSCGNCWRFFLPGLLLPSLNNRMTNIFKGIPLTNEVRVCILCRTLVSSVEEMNQHIFAAHVPEVKKESKTHQCFCGEVFFNSILLKHHIFKMKGNHGVCDGVTPIPDDADREHQEIVNVYQVYGTPLTIGLNDIIITGLSNHTAAEENENSNDDEDMMEFEVMEA